MTTPYLISSKQIRTDGFYYLIRYAYPHRNDLENSFHFNGLALSSSGKLFTFSKSFNRKEREYLDYGIKGVFKICMKQIENTKMHDMFFDYEISYNAHNLTANFKCPDFEETIVCSLYSSNELRVETYLNHFSNNFIEDNGDYIYNFISFEEIEKGISPSVENSLYPPKKKKRWWNI